MSTSNTNIKTIADYFDIDDERDKFYKKNKISNKLKRNIVKFFDDEKQFRISNPEVAKKLVEAFEKWEDEMPDDLIKRQIEVNFVKPVKKAYAKLNKDYLSLVNMKNFCTTVLNTFNRFNQTTYYLDGMVRNSLSNENDLEGEGKQKGIKARDNFADYLNKKSLLMKEKCQKIQEIQEKYALKADKEDAAIKEFNEGISCEKIDQKISEANEALKNAEKQAENQIKQINKIFEEYDVKTKQITQDIKKIPISEIKTTAQTDEVNQRRLNIIKAFLNDEKFIKQLGRIQYFCDKELNEIEKSKKFKKIQKISEKTLNESAKKTKLN